MQIGSCVQNHIVEKGHKTARVQGNKVFAGRHNETAIIVLWSQQTGFWTELPEFEEAHYEQKPTSYSCLQQNVKNETHTKMLSELDTKEIPEEHILELQLQCVNDQRDAQFLYSIFIRQFLSALHVFERI